MAKRDVINKLQDMTHLAWDEKTVTSGTGGTFLKSRRKSNKRDYFYKLSCYNSTDGIYGHESVNELIASRLLEKLGISHVPYRLIHAKVIVNQVEYETWLSESRDYRSPGEKAQALETFFDLNSNEGERRLDFCASFGWARAIHEMMAFDYLIMNRDRHGANIDVLISGSERTIAPLYDHGLSFVCSSYNNEEKVRNVDPLKPIRVHNYLGNKESLEENLSLVPRGVFTSHLTSEDRAQLFRGLDKALSETHLDAIWRIITSRWQVLIEMGIIHEA